MSTDLPARLAALRAATEAMTPGPWFTDDAPRFGGSVDANIDGLPRQVAMASGQAPAAERRSSPHLIMLANAAGIVALRNEALPLLDALLAEVQAARDHAEYVESVLDAHMREAAEWRDATDSLTPQEAAAKAQAARAEAVACRAVAVEACDFARGALDNAPGFTGDPGDDSAMVGGYAALAALRAKLTTPDPAAAQAAIDEYTEAVMEACGAIDAERTPRTISARATVARLLGMPEVAR